MIYRAMVRSSLDYGSLVYGSAARTNLAKLDIVQATALRVFVAQSGPLPSRLSWWECVEMPLRLRREKIALQYAGRIQNQEQCNPVRCVLEESWETAQGGRETIVKRVWDKSPEVNLDMSLRVVWPSVHPWLLPVPEVDWTVRDILREKGKGNSADVVREVISEFDVYLNI